MRESPPELTWFSYFHLQGVMFTAWLNNDGIVKNHGWVRRAARTLCISSKWWVGHLLSMPTGNASNRSFSSEIEKYLSSLNLPEEACSEGNTLFYCVHETLLRIWNKDLCLYVKSSLTHYLPILARYTLHPRLWETAGQPPKQLIVGKYVQPYFWFSSGRWSPE